MPTGQAPPPDVVPARRAPKTPTGPMLSIVPDTPGCPDAQAFDSLLASWERHGADIADALRPGLSATAVTAVERELGIALPPSLRTWWQRWDGVDPVVADLTTGDLTLPTVGPGGWVPLPLHQAAHLYRLGRPVVWQGRFPVMTRDDEYLTVRLATGGDDAVEVTTNPPAVIEQVFTDDPDEGGFVVTWPELMAAWTAALGATVYWLPTTRAWHCDPFSLRVLDAPHLVW